MYQLPPLLKAHLHSLGMQTEVLDSRSAGSTFNILVQEGRSPAAAILPRIPTSARTGKSLVELRKTEKE
jgi:NADH dehydrogenase [ubiquinone] 1 alpha subcomplex assembly factor 3